MRKLRIVRTFIRLFIVLIVLYLIKLFAGDIIHVRSIGMEGTMAEGDRIVISKIHTGARTPITPLEVPFSDWVIDSATYSEGVQFAPNFLPKLYDPYYNQPVVFNQPTIDFNPIDRKPVLTSRIVGLPGDTITINKMDVAASGKLLVEPEGIQWPYELKVQEKFQEKVIPQLDINSYIPSNKGTYEALMTKDQATMLMQISHVRYAKVKWKNELKNDSLALYGKKRWSLFNYGPIHIPKEGEELEISIKNIETYRPILENHENVTVQVEDDKVFINGREATKYIFQQNYYFVLGDNRANTIDSRHFGPVPASHIIGQPMMVLYSYRPNRESFLKSIRPDRSFLPVQ